MGRISINNLALAILGVIVFTVFSFEVTLDCLGEEKENWQHRLPVSMNGELPSDLPKGFEQKHWHSLRLHLLFRLKEKEATFDLGRFQSKRLFPTDEGEELKKAIVNVDIARINELIAQGVDVNQKGKGDLTPLYLAMFVDTDPRPFEILIENGADPKVPCFVERFDTPPFLGLGSTVLHLASMPRYNRLFKSTLQSVEDPNVEFQGILTPPLNWATGKQPDAVERLVLLAKKGVHFDHLDGQGLPYLDGHLQLGTLAQENAARQRHFKLALLAIQYDKDHPKSPIFSDDSGAKETFFEGSHFRPIHFLALSSIQDDNEFTSCYYAKTILRSLEKNGESMERAIEDVKRWKQWKKDGRDDLIEEEHRQRVADEARQSDASGEKTN